MKLEITHNDLAPAAVSVPPPAITRVNIYRQLGAWYYAAWAGDTYDHSDPVDARDDASETKVRAEMARQFPSAEIVRVPDIMGGGR